MIMKRHKLKILILLSLFQFAFTWSWINNNPLWDLYFKVKGIKIQRIFKITENLEFKIETRPSYLNNPLSIRPEKLVDPHQYYLQGSIIYRF